MIAFLLAAALASATHAAPRAPELAAKDVGEPGSVFDNGPVTLAGHTKRISAVAFAASSSTLLTASWDDSARLWDITSGAMLKQFTIGGFLDGVDVSRDGAWIALAGTHGVQILNARTGATARTLPQGSRAVAFSPNGSTILIGRFDEADLWERAGGRRCDLYHTSSVMAVGFTADGARFFTASRDGEVRLWSPASCGSSKDVGHFQISYDGDISAAAISPDGSLVAIGTEGSLVQVYDAKLGRRLLSLPGHEDEIKTVAFSADGKTLLTAGGKSVRLWEAATGRSTRVITLDAGVESAAFSPDGSHVAVASGNEAKVYRIAYTPEELDRIRREMGQHAKPSEDQGSGRFKLPPDGSFFQKP